MNNSFTGRISYVTVALLLATGFFFPLAVLAQETVDPLVEILKNAKTNMPYETKMSSCPNLYRNLSFGSRGNDVVELQNFLIAQGDLAVGNNTGYFGRMTESAVQKFQVGRGIASSGTAATTGYGAVGPRTRAKIASVCGGGGGTVSANFSAYPTSGMPPLTVKFTSNAQIPGPYTLDGGSFKVVFGDGQEQLLKCDYVPSETQSPLPGGGVSVSTGPSYCTAPQVSHTYNTSGNYTAQLVHSGNTLQGSPVQAVIGTATITVTGTSVTPNDKQSCENIGGTWGSVGDVPNATPYCNMPTSDAGKACADSSQCQSFCKATTYAEPGTPVGGACYGWKEGSCTGGIANGKAVPVACY